MLKHKQSSIGNMVRNMTLFINVTNISLESILKTHDPNNEPWGTLFGKVNQLLYISY